MVYQETTQHWEKLYFELTPLYCSVFVIILSCDDKDKLPFYLPEIWHKSRLYTHCRAQLGKKTIPTKG